MAPTLEPAPTCSGVRVNRYRILDLLIVCLYVVCRAESVAGTSGDVREEMPGAADAEAETFFAQQRAAAILDGGGARFAAVPVEGRGKLAGVIGGAGLEVVNRPRWDGEMRALRAAAAFALALAMLDRRGLAAGEPHRPDSVRDD